MVDWTPPDFANYLQGDVWYKTNNEQAERLTITEGVPADEMGWQGEWLYGGSGKCQCVIPQAIVGDTYRIAVCTKDEYGISTSPDLSPQIDITVAIKTMLPNTPDDFALSFSNVATATWKEVTNSDIAFYEVRRDTNPGIEDANLLARTNGLSATVPITERSGKLYLYAKSAVGKYSAPAELKYNKTLPPKPEPPALSPKLGGMSIRCKAMPSDCLGVRYYINDNSVYNQNNTLSYICDAGVYDVTCAYVDMFGDGPTSEKSTCVVKVVIDEDMIADSAITAAKLDKLVRDNIKQAKDDAQKALEDAKANADGLRDLTGSVYSKTETDNLVSSSFANFKNNELVNYSTTQQTSDMISSSITSFKNEELSQYTTLKQTKEAIYSMALKIDDSTNQKLESYSTITQTNEAISLAVSNIDLDGNKLISKINLSDGGILLDGKLIHVTGQTLFDDNIVTQKMLQAKSVDAEKINVESLSAICATIGTLRTATSGARTEIKDNLIEVYDANNVLRVRMGVW